MFDYCNIRDFEVRERLRQQRLPGDLLFAQILALANVSYGYAKRYEPLGNLASYGGCGVKHR